jgi:hypothetical protein
MVDTSVGRLPESLPIGAGRAAVDVAAADRHRPGPPRVLHLARAALLDAQIALGDHADEVTIIGAQMIHHTGAADVFDRREPQSAS